MEVKTVSVLKVFEATQQFEMTSNSLGLLISRPRTEIGVQQRASISIHCGVSIAKSTFLLCGTILSETFERENQFKILNCHQS